MAQNEKTSSEIAIIASAILRMENPVNITDEFWEEIKSVAGSALTQTADKKETVLKEIRAMINEALNS